MVSAVVPASSARTPVTWAPTSEELTELMRLPVAERERVEQWHRALLGVSRPITQAIERVAGIMDVSFPTARRHYDLWRKAHRDWRVLVDQRVCPRVDPTLPEATVTWFVGLVVENGRKIAPAYRAAVRELRAGNPVPGLPDGWNRRFLPPGWSLDNFRRRARMSRFEMAAARVGRSAASSFGPHVLTTRVGLNVGQRIQFDDMWHDFKVVRIGSNKPMRLLQLSAFDVFSACQFARGLKPRIEDPDTGKRLNLREDDMLFLLVHVLTDYGYHPDGCTLVVEHGTAAIREDIEQRLSDITGGKIRVVRSGVQRAAAFAGQYDCSTGGNFRLKAHLESLHNLIHNEAADTLLLPGATGSNSRINAPEELAGREQYMAVLVRAMQALPVDVRDSLRLPFIEERAACHIVNEIMERINRRTDHALEGWTEAGLTTVDYCVPDVGTFTSSRLLALPADRRAAVEAVAQPVARSLSPREVFDAGRSGLIRFRPEQAAALLYDRQSVEAVVRDGMIAFRNAAVGPGEFRYLAHHWTDGDKFAVVVNPFAPQVAHLFDARGRWVGTVESWGRVSMEDTEALERQMGRRAKIERERLAPLAAAGARLTRKRLADATHNAELLARHAGATVEMEEIGTDALMNAVD